MCNQQGGIQQNIGCYFDNEPPKTVFSHDKDWLKKMEKGVLLHTKGTLSSDYVLPASIMKLQAKVVPKGKTVD